MNTQIVAGSIAAISTRTNTSLAESFLSAEAILLVDMSGSMLADDAPGGKRRHEAAEDELRRLQAELPGKIAVVAFSNTVEFCPGGIPSPLFARTDMAKALRFVKAADGLARIILISDGCPDSEAETLAVARTFRHRIDTIYIGPEEIGGGREFLRQLATATGGQAVKSEEIAMLANPVRMLLLT